MFLSAEDSPLRNYRNGAYKTRGTVHTNQENVRINTCNYIIHDPLKMNPQTIDFHLIRQHIAAADTATNRVNASSQPEPPKR